MSNSYWLIIKLSLITLLLGLAQVTKLCLFLFELGSQTGKLWLLVLDCYWLRVRMPRVRITHLITFILYACGLGSKLLLAILVLCQFEHQFGQLGSSVVLYCNIYWKTSGQNSYFTIHTWFFFFGSLKNVSKNFCPKSGIMTWWICSAH